MRILIAGQMPPPVGGQNINIKKLYELLVEEEGYQVEHWEFSFTKEVSQFRSINFFKVFALFQAIWKLLRLRFKGKIDIIVYPSGGPHTTPILRDILLLPFAIFFSKKVWVHFHAAGISQRLPTLHPFLRLPLLAIHKRCFGGIALTPLGLEDPQALGIPQAFAIPIGIEDYNTSFQKDPSRFSERPLRFIHAGHLREDKGTNVLIQAFGRLYKDYPHIELHLIGECSSPSLEKLLPQLINASPAREAIFLRGLLPSTALFEELKQSHLFIFPSIAPSESYGMVLIEAMMAGIPIVAADWRAAKQVLTPELGGLCYPIGEKHEESLYQALLQCMVQQALWSDWSERNRSIYTQHYTLSTYKQALIKLFTL